MHATLNIAFKAAKRASKIILHHIDRLEDLTITEKEKNNFVTNVDTSAQQAIVETLQQAFPDHGIIGEEGDHQRVNADYVWIIDPLDGTTNYLHGFMHFCISIALQVKGQIEHGLIYDPIRQELFTASRGRGAQVNDHRMRVSKCTTPERAFIASGFPHRRHQDTRRDFTLLASLYQKISDLRVSGSAALDLAYVAAGRLDGYFEFGLQPWDFAAGSLMVQEAGGYVSDIDGSKQYLKSGNIIAATPKTFTLLADHLQTFMKNQL